MSIDICIQMVNLTIEILKVLANDSAANLPFVDKITVSSLLKLLVHREYQIVGMSVTWMSSFKMQRGEPANIYRKQTCSLNLGHSFENFYFLKLCGL